MNWGWLRVQQKHDLLVDVPHFDVSKKVRSNQHVINCCGVFLASLISRCISLAYPSMCEMPFVYICLYRYVYICIFSMRIA